MDGDGSVRSAAAYAPAVGMGARRCVRAGAPAGVPGGWLGSETCLGNGAVLVRWTPAETCFGTNKPVLFRVLACCGGSDRWAHHSWLSSRRIVLAGLAGFLLQPDTVALSIFLNKKLQVELNS
jgi:hypothetical protein